jgi:tryptophan halogenase
MAAAHLTRHFPEVDLLHIFDPAIPPIGVGEGTTPGFRIWLDEIAPVEFESLQRQCLATRKCGVQFENWGSVKPVFRHDFVPPAANGLHISASRVIPFLQGYVRAELVTGHVTEVVSSDSGAEVRMAGGSSASADLVVDARGFPPLLTDDHLRLSWVPTNSALVTRCPQPRESPWTRAVARPHGWIFVIPLTDSTAYGYIHGGEHASTGEIEADFHEFLASEQVESFAEPRAIRYPNFVCRRPFDGRVFRIGNAASFVEPLEASSLAVVRIQLELVEFWLRRYPLMALGRLEQHVVSTLNDRIRDLILELSLFIGWHYASGSIYDTPFWRSARARFRQGLLELVPKEIGTRLVEQLQHASRLPLERIRAIRSAADLDRLVAQFQEFPRPFGGISPIGFAQLREGLSDAVEAE